MTRAYNEAAFRMLMGMRGGVSKTCDFCGQPFTPERYPVPEEAGAWSCSECEARWDKEDEDLRRQRGKNSP